jgi:hypothetical protein
MAPGDGGHNDDQGQDRKPARPWTPPRIPHRAATRRAREVGDQLIEICVGLRGQAAINPDVELLSVQTSFDVAPPQDLSDGIPLLIADTEQAVARPNGRIVRLVI